MTIYDVDKRHCTGCCACMNNCPKKAIHMIVDCDGFYVPEIEENKCINCGICYAKCPENKGVLNEKTEIGYLVRLNNEKLLKNSASGGAFVGIANYMIKKYHAIVIGAAITEDLSVKHIIIDTVEGLIQLQNSKYVQSYIGDIYVQIKKALTSGRRVLFSGTPCQIAGLYSVIPSNKREYLYTVDLVCHGVPSPALLKRQLGIDSESKQGKVVNYQFRYKNPYSKFSSYMMMMMMMQRGLPIVRRIKQDVYFKLFMQGMDFRESCYNCQYASLRRMGDFTIGDCDSSEYYPHFFPNESNSILLVNSEKGALIWDELAGDFDYTLLDVERESKYNHQLNHPFKRPLIREGIYDELLNEDWGKIQAKYVVRQNKSDRYKLMLLLNSPEWFVKLISKLRAMMTR